MTFRKYTNQVLCIIYSIEISITNKICARESIANVHIANNIQANIFFDEKFLKFEGPEGVTEIEQVGR